MTDSTRPQWSREIGRSERSKRFQRASAVYWGEQYNHLSPWNDEGSRDKPLRERQPSVKVRMVYATVNTVNAYLFGAGRLPQFKVTSIRDDEGRVIPADELTDADREELALVNEEIQRIRKAARLDRDLSELGRHGLLHGTVALAGHQLESGRMWSEVIQVADAKPTFASEDRELADEYNLREDDLLSLDEYWIKRNMTLDEGEALTIHRRTWTVEQTIEYVPIELEGDGADVTLSDLEWSQDNERTVQHDLGFVPVVWVRNIRIAGDIDGAPIVGEPEFAFEDEINYTLSQVGSAVRYNSEPTVVFMNVANITEDGDQKLQKGSNKSLSIESYGIAGTPPADAKFLEITGSGQTIAMDYVESLRKLYQQVTRVMEHDPEKAVGALSGTAIERLMMPLISLVDILRSNYGDALARWFELMLRISSEDDFSQYEVSVVWPAIIEPSASDLQLIATPIAALYLQGLITLSTAVEVLSPFLDIENVEAYLVELAEESGQDTGGTTTDDAAQQDDADDEGLF